MHALVNIFTGDNCVVHHNAKHGYKGEQRNNIKCAADQGHKNKGSHKGHRHPQKDPKCDRWA